MKLPTAPKQYDSKNEQDTRGMLEAEDARNLKKNTDADLGSGALILKSPNGTRWRLTIDNTGALITVSI